MSKNIQNCAICGEKLNGSYRMQMMMGPKGYRSYAVCQGACVVKKAGSKRQLVRSAKRAGAA